MDPDQVAHKEVLDLQDNVVNWVRLVHQAPLVHPVPMGQQDLSDLLVLVVSQDHPEHVAKVVP